MISSHDLEKILTSVSLHQMTHQKNSSNSKCSGNFLAATPFFGMSKIQLNDLKHSWDVRTFTHEKGQRTSRTTKKYFTYVTRRARSKLNFKYKFRRVLLPTRGTFYFRKLCHFPCPNMVTEDKFPCPRECTMRDHQLNLAPKFKICMRAHQKDCKRTSAHFSVRKKHHVLSRTNR